MNSECIITGLRDIKNSLEYGYALHTPTLTEYPDTVRIVVPKSPRHYVGGSYEKFCKSKGLLPVNDFSNIAICDNKEYERSESSCIRAVRSVRDLIMCNCFDYFVTLTCDAEKVNRYSLEEASGVIRKTIHNTNRRRATPIQYVFVPEVHKKGGYHFHGVVRGFNKNDLVRNEHKYLEWSAMREKLGFMSMNKIRDNVKCATYVSKYITKSFSALSVGSEAKKTHLFWASKGLNRPIHARVFCNDERLRNFVKTNNINIYESDYCRLFTLNKDTPLYEAFIAEYKDVILYM